MTFIIICLVASVIDGIYVLVEPLIANLWGFVFNVESFIQNSGYITAIEQLKTVFYSIGVGLIILKFCKKAFDIYVLWSDGDPDVEPTGLIVNFVKAIVVAMCFPTIWQWFVDIGGNTVNTIFNSLSTNDNAFTNSFWQTLGLVPTLFAAIFIIIALVLCFKFMMRGLEITLLVIGVPIACTGLLDNDKGVWKAYLNQFVKAIFTTMVQLVLVKLGMMIGLGADMSNVASIFWGIACLVLALSVPKIMNEFLLVSGGGGGITNKLYSASMAGNQIKRLVGKLK